MQAANIAGSAEKTEVIDEDTGNLCNEWIFAENWTEQDQGKVKDFSFLS